MVAGIRKAVAGGSHERRRRELVTAFHAELGDRLLYCDGAPPLLFTENDTNTERLFDMPNATPYVKDAFHSCVVHGNSEAVNPAATGTKAAAHYRLDIGAGQSATVRLCLTDVASRRPFAAFDQTLTARRREADEFYRYHTPDGISDDAAQRSCARPAAVCSGPSSTYFFDVNFWLREHGVDPFDAFVVIGAEPPLVPHVQRRRHLDAGQVGIPVVCRLGSGVSRGLAGAIDPDFAKHQLNLMLKPDFCTPTASCPPMSGTSATSTRRCMRGRRCSSTGWSRRRVAKGDLEFLKRSFGKLLMNFTWWVNRKDRLGKSVFEGGFLGLDNIGVFDRSAELPTGGHLEQADGTAWMAMFCQNMFEIAVELATHDPTYDDLVFKFAEHFLWIGIAMNKVGHDGMWDEEDGFYYDVLRLPDGSPTVSRSGRWSACCRSAPRRSSNRGSGRAYRASWRGCTAGGPHSGTRERRPPDGPGHFNAAGRSIAALVDADRLRRILSRMLDEQEFLGPYGIRSVSKWHEQHPYVVDVGGKDIACRISRPNPIPACSAATRTGADPCGFR